MIEIMSERPRRSLALGVALTLSVVSVASGCGGGGASGEAAAAKKIRLTSQRWSLFPGKGLFVPANGRVGVCDGEPTPLLTAEISYANAAPDGHYTLTPTSTPGLQIRERLTYPSRFVMSQGTVSRGVKVPWLPETPAPSGTVTIEMRSGGRRLARFGITVVPRHNCGREPAHAASLEDPRGDPQKPAATA
jgi:hypothetical protein